MISSYKESNDLNLLVWRDVEEKPKRLYIIDPRSINLEDYSGDDYPVTAVETERVEKALNYFHNIKAIIEEPSEVRRYLYRYPEIAELAQFVSEQVYHNFDSDAQLCLGVNGDEYRDSEYLALFIRLPKYDDNAMDRIEKIQKSYFDLLSTMTGWFLFATDFSPSR